VQAVKPTRRRHIVESLEVGIIKRKVKDGHVLLHPGFLDSLGHHHDVLLNAPTSHNLPATDIQSLRNRGEISFGRRGARDAGHHLFECKQRYLRCSFAVLCRNAGNLFVIEPLALPECPIRLDNDPLLLEEIDGLFPVKEWIDFDLIDCWLDLMLTTLDQPKRQTHTYTYPYTHIHIDTYIHT